MFLLAEAGSLIPAESPPQQFSSFFFSPREQKGSSKNILLFPRVPHVIEFTNFSSLMSSISLRKIEFQPFSFYLYNPLYRGIKSWKQDRMAKDRMAKSFFSSPFCLYHKIFEKTFRHFGKHKSHKCHKSHKKIYGHVDP
jgi:hypothetical protein